MAKLDFSTIDGWDSMSAEERISAIENYEYEDNAAALADMIKDRDRYKESNSKANSKLSQMEKERREALGADEKKALETSERLAALEAENANLKKEKQVALLTGTGIPKELATEKVEAILSGDFDKIAAIDEKILTLHTKNIEKSLVNAVPPPASGSKEDTVTRDTYAKMTSQERIALKQSNPEMYKQLTGGNK